MSPIVPTTKCKNYYWECLELLLVGRPSGKDKDGTYDKFSEIIFSCKDTILKPMTHGTAYNIASGFTRPAMIYL